MKLPPELLALGVLYLLTRDKKAKATATPAVPKAARQIAGKAWAAELQAAGANAVIAAGLARAALLRKLGDPTPERAAQLYAFFGEAWADGQRHLAPAYKAKATDEDALWYATVAATQPAILKGVTGTGARVDAKSLVKVAPDVVKGANYVAFGPNG